MRRLLLLVLMISIFSGFLLGQVTDTTKKRFEKAQVIRQTKTEIVKFEPIKPDIERYQKKTDTDFTRGFYQLYKKNIRTTNKVILNKWLKELK